MYNEVIKLISEEVSINEYGDRSIEETERTIFAKVQSIGQSEFYQAQGVGLKPTIKFIIADYLDYQNEKKLIYTQFNSEQEDEYTVLRTYRNGNELEITCYKGI